MMILLYYSVVKIWCQKTR